MTAPDLVYPVLAGLVAFVCFFSLPLLAFALLHMIGKSN